MKFQHLFWKIACVSLLASAAIAAQKTRVVRSASQPYRVLKTSGDISDFAFSGDGKTLVTASIGWPGVDDSNGTQDDIKSTITIWDFTTRKVKRRILVFSSVENLALSPDGKTLATHDNKYSTYGTMFDPATRTFVSQRFCLRIWNVSTGRLLHTFKRGYHDRGIAFSDDGRVLAAANRKCGSDPCNAFITLYDTRTWKPYRTLHGIEGIVGSVSISPDKRWIAASAGVTEGSEEDFSLWDAHSGRRVRHFFKDADDYTDDGTLKNPALAKLPFEDPTFLPDNKSLIAGNILYRFAPPSKVEKILHRVPLQDCNNVAVHSGRTTKLALIRDVASQTVLQVWRLHPQKLLFKTRYQERDVFQPTKFSTDGRALAMVDGKALKLWRVP